MKRAFGVVGVLWMYVAPCAAQNWPQFRGPQASGVGTGSPPASWNVETGEHIKWKVRVPGLAHSSPIVWGDRVFVTTALSSKTEAPSLETGWMGGSGESAGEDEPWSWRVLCFNKADGKLVWERVAHSGVPKVKRHAKATHANSTPATDGKHVVAFFGSQGLHCYDTDGKPLWSKDLGLLRVGPYNAPEMEWGFASSPIIHDGLVIVQCDALNTGFWAAFDIETGKEIRRVKREDVATWSTPAIYQEGGTTQLICNGYREMSGYDLGTGKQLWTLQGGGDVPVPTPLIAHNLIYITNGHGRSPMYVIKPDARGDVTPDAGDIPAGIARMPAGIAWWNPKAGSYMPTPIIVGDSLVVGNDNGILSVLDAMSGEPVYRERLSERVTYSASPVAAGGKVYFTSEDGDIVVIKAGDEYEHLATNTMNEVCMATPAISDGLLLIRGKDHLFCIGE
jgi:outer membrane protein assembly factor BamB